MRAEWRLRRVRDGSVEELPFPRSPQARAAQELVGGTREVEGQHQWRDVGEAGGGRPLEQRLDSKSEASGSCQQ